MTAGQTADRQLRSGATILELIVSMIIVIAILFFVASMTDVSRRNLTEIEESSEEKSNVRKAMNALSRKLNQAVLNSYWDYNDPVEPTLFQRQSELHFVSGPAESLLGTGRTVTGHSVFFQAPLGYGGAEAGSLGGGVEFDDLHDSLNCWGYFIEFGSDLDPIRPLRPDFLRNETALHPARLRFRLMEFRLPSEKMNLFGRAFPRGSTLGEQITREATHAWFREPSLLLANSRPIAENIIALTLKPRAPQERGRAKDIAPQYFYDTRRHQYEGEAGLAAISRHQLPPVMDMTMVAVSEDSYARALEVNPNLGEELLSILKGLFQEAARAEEDLRELEQLLIDKNLSYRTLTISVAIPAAKWVTSTESDPASS